MTEIKRPHLGNAPALREKPAAESLQTSSKKQAISHQHPDFIACQNLVDHLDDDQMYYQELMLLD